MKNSKEAKSNIFGKRLKTARLSLGIPQDKLGVSIGLDEHTASARISRYESGIHEPAIPTAQHLAQVMKIPLAYLYCEDDRMAQLLLCVSQLNENQWAELSSFLIQQFGLTLE
jgi:transcriptional regulator with XRE-family HTH domain